MASVLVVLASAIAFSACSSASQEKYYLEERVPGESLSFRCSTNTSQDHVTLYKGNKQSSKKQVLHLYGGTEQVPTYEPRYKNRVGFRGSLKYLSINITNLTEEDSGVYWCLYTGLDENANTVDIRASEVVALVVKRPVLCPEPSPGDQNPNANPNPPDPSHTNFIVILISIITAVIVFLMFAIMLTFFVIPKIKKLKATQVTPSRGNDSVYEVMSATLRRT